MKRSEILFLLFFLLLAGTVCLASACARQPAASNTVNTESGAVPNSTPASTNPQSSPSALSMTDQTATKTLPAPTLPPTAAEVGDAVTRVFEKAATPETASKLRVVVGDFNGDGSEDLAVVVKPSEGKLAEVNNEMANWILEDPRRVPLPRSNLALPATNKPPPVRAEKGDTLLAIIHGVGPRGWRNADAKQTFLLKNGPAADLTVQPMKRLRESKDRQRLPPIRGDAINGTIAGKAGLIVWTGAKYAWYSPDTR